MKNEKHPTYNRTIMDSPQWKEWEGVAHTKGFDFHESQETGWLSQEHFQAFLQFVGDMRERTTKKEISTTEYQALEGLRVLSAQLNKDLERLVFVVADITGESLDEYGYGLATDFIFSPDETVKSHLKKLNLTINRKK
jgi:hypothetical protein